MHRHRFIQYALAVVLALVAGLSLLLWWAGLPPVYAALLGVNAVTLLLYGYDKRQAIVGRTRIPEVALHGVALLGGSPAAMLAQGLFRHKTRKRGFRMVFAGIVLLQIGLLYAGWRYFRT